ncbi:RHS repeat domain-containing protein [Treponema pedis]|uniref:RHS repeat domain-containing protein n=1 Tax=Treponema pedis TaxID=409322 RepID=UPI00041210EC|nr:RHS repeat-associated core domain-containing protein [Treponema pedis]
MGNITRETCNGHEITSRYDILGRRAHTASSSGADIATELDSLGNITGIEAQGWQATIDYDRQGLEIQRTLSGGLTAQTRRDKLGRVRYQNAVSNGHTHLDREYRWGTDDRLAKIIDLKTNETTAFEYNDRGFLTRAVYGGKEEVWRTADKLGNLYESEAQTDRRYTGSQLQHDGKWWYYYDNEGNLILKSPYQRHGKNPDTSWQSGSWAYKWNANGSLKSVKRADGKEFSFKYDAFGRRISKSYGSREFLYIWDKNVPLHEIKKEGKREDEITTWVFQGFTPVAKIQGDKHYSIISDHLGTPLQAIDTQGNKVWERTLDIYGKVRKETEETANFVPFLFQGQYLDAETELVYNYKRYYSQETGAYISQDPIGLFGKNPNIYAYVFDSNTEIDPFGLACQKRNSKGQFTSEIDEEGKSGKDFEKEVVDKLREDTNIEILGTGVHIKTSEGDRFVDVLYKSKDSDKKIAAEIKSNNANRSKSQKAKDKIIDEGGGTFGKGKSVPDKLKGQPAINVTTIEIRV